MQPFSGRGTRVGGTGLGINYGARGVPPYRGAATSPKGRGVPQISGRGKVEALARGMAIPVRKQSGRGASPKRSNMFSFNSAANFAEAMSLGTFGSKAAPKRPAVKKAAAAQPKSLPGAKKKLDQLIFSYQLLDTVDFNDPAQRNRLIRSISEGDHQTFLLMTNGLNPDQRLQDVIVKDAQGGDDRSLFQYAVDCLNEQDNKAGNLRILERMIDVRYPLKKEFQEEEMALLQLANLENSDFYYILLERVFQVHGTVDFRDSKGEGLIHALADGRGTLARVVETMRYGINTDFSLQSVSKYLRDNDEIQFEEKRKILKFLFAFYNFEKRRMVITAYEKSREQQSQVGLGQLNKFMFVRLLSYI